MHKFSQWLEQRGETLYQVVGDTQNAFEDWVEMRPDQAGLSNLRLGAQRVDAALAQLRGMLDPYRHNVIARLDELKRVIQAWQNQYGAYGGQPALSPKGKWTSFSTF
jgi:hypothetical protein